MEWFRTKAAELPGVDFDELERQLENAEGVAEIATLIVTIDYYRDVRLDLGAVGRLMTAGEPVDVMPWRIPNCWQRQTR